MPAQAKKRTFEHSNELKRLFNQYFEVWSKKHRASLNELAERCGVSAQYLAHIGRYGRIPGKPILLLLALNFELSDPRQLLRAAGMQEPWPYEPGIGLRTPGAAETGFLSLHVDMAGFTNAIREIVRGEIKPRSLEELLAGRPLRIGLNRGQTFLFERTKDEQHEGFFPELLQLMSLALHVSVELREVEHSRFGEALRAGEIDVFGPVYYTAPRIGEALFTNPFCRVRFAALVRAKKCPGLADIPAPKRVSDLRKRDYRIAVHAESMSHHFAVGDLGIPAERLIPCETADETIERLLMNNIPRPAHVLLTDAPHAIAIRDAHPRDLQIALSEKTVDAVPYEDTFAVRPDWPAVVTILNDIIELLGRNGALQRLYERTISESAAPGIVVGGG